uniref:Histonelysine Nmethyltransferase SETMARlike [Megachile rotundata] n=1 Tax=Lepeophtheirus salmonis TaxID=72036 RepID=A0A0K2TF70_LEPSM
MRAIEQKWLALGNRRQQDVIKTTRGNTHLL